MSVSKPKRAVLALPLLFATVIFPATGQRQDYGQRSNNSAYYNGVRSGGRGGDYYNERDPHYNGHNYYHDDHRQGGIGPGKGALIGGAGGAALGALFGGGLKGTIIGGAAGAGIGAVVGQAAQNNRDNNYHRPY